MCVPFEPLLLVMLEREVLYGQLFVVAAAPYRLARQRRRHRLCTLINEPRSPDTLSATHPFVRVQLRLQSCAELRSGKLQYLLLVVLAHSLALAFDPCPDKLARGVDLVSDTVPSDVQLLRRLESRVTYVPFVLRHLESLLEGLKPPSQLRPVHYTGDEIPT